jgi:hypothetical protein
VLGANRVGRDNEHHRIGGQDQAFEPRPPGLAGQDVLLVEVGLEACRDEREAQLLGERAVLARVGNEYAGLAGLAATGNRLRLIEQFPPPVMCGQKSHCPRA